MPSGRSRSSTLWRALPRPSAARMSVAAGNLYVSRWRRSIAGVSAVETSIPAIVIHVCRPARLSDDFVPDPMLDSVPDLQPTTTTTPWPTGDRTVPREGPLSGGAPERRLTDA